MRLIALSLVSLMMLFCLATTASAGITYLKNGDRITGKILEIWDGDVIIEPEYDDAVKITISLDLVDYMESQRQFEVILKDGRKVVAELAGRGPDGKQRVMIDGQATLVDMNQLEELDEIEEYFDWESHIDFNFSIDKGNTDALNTRFFADTNLKLGDHRQVAALTLSREEQNNVTTKDQGFLQYNYNWVFSDPWFFGVALSAERDPIRNLDHRVLIGATGGRDLFNRPRLFLNIQAGLGYLSEKDTASETNTSTAIIWALRYRQDFFAKDLELYHDDTINAYVTGRTNTVIKTVTGLRYEFGDLLYFNTSLVFDYESEPLEGAENEDLSFVVGLGTEF